LKRHHVAIAVVKIIQAIHVVRLHVLMIAAKVLSTISKIDKINNKTKATSRATVKKMIKIKVT